MIGVLLKLSAAALLAALSCGIGAADEGKQVREPLKYRIASFHRGRADKQLIRRAAELGFNGVQFQIEGSTVKGLTEFAERDKAEGYIDLCHKLGMAVTLWVHELSDVPTKDSDPGYLGPIKIENEKLWTHLDERYEWLLGKLLPDVDGLVLTVVETQINMTDTPMMLKLVDIIRSKCLKYKKQFVVRTFVWHPAEFVGVMECIKQLPDDITIMTKCVPQDWQLRGMDDKAIGAVGNHEQIEEYDVAGEYFLTDAVANCMPALLKRQFDYGVAHGIDGICVRVDRYDTEIFQEPNEVNMWALGMFASGKTDSVDEVWKAWATARFGAKAADGVIKALKPTQQVMEEMLSVGPFTFGDTRGFPANGDRIIFDCNWQNQRWDSSYVPIRDLAVTGDPLFTRKEIRKKAEAARVAQKCLDDLELVKGDLDPADYDILKTKLFTMQVQLAYRAPITIAYLKYRRILSIQDAAEKKRLAGEIRDEMKVIRSIAAAKYPPAREITHLGRKWHVDAPLRFYTKNMNEWVAKMEALLVAQGLS